MRDDWLVGLAGNRAAPDEVLLRLLRPEAEVAWRALGTRAGLPPRVVDAMLRHPDWRVRGHLTDSPDLDLAVLLALAGDPEPRVRARLAGTPVQPVRLPLPDDVLLALLGDSDPDVLAELGTAPNFRRALALAVLDPRPATRVWACGFLRALSAAERDALLADEDPAVRRRAEQVAAADLAYDRQVMEPADLPTRPSHAWWHILMHRRLSRALVDQVLADGQADDLVALAGNSSVPSDVVAVLLGSDEPKVRQSLAGRTGLDVSVLEALAEDADPGVRRMVAGNPGTPVGWMHALLDRAGVPGLGPRRIDDRL